MANYSTDEDLEKYHSPILSYGVDTWEDFHTDAKFEVDRDLDLQWYRKNFKGWDTTEYAFNPDLILNADTELTRLSAFKTLGLVFNYLSKNDEDDFATLRTRWEKRYADELGKVIEAGMDYDIDESGDISEDEAKRGGVWSLSRA